MRVERLSLDFFGHFTGKELDFGKAGRASDFHLIYGLNEAGKTTVMEAFLRLLYGFPHREPYGFQHQRPNLKVSGLLDINGETRPFTRLPSRAKNLRGEADAILPEAAIASHLGGLSMEDYRSLLCLDDNTIEKGGEDIASARGDIGRLLFSAAAGVAELNTILEQARTEAGAIYRKRASTTVVAKLKHELAAVESDIRKSDVSAHAWRQLNAALQAAGNEETNARALRDRLRTEQAATDAMKRALDDLGELDRLLDEIADLADYPVRIDINPEMLVTMTAGRGQVVAELQRLEDSLERTRTEHAKLVLDEQHLALADQLEGLDELRSRMQTAVADLPRRTRALEEAEADMKRIAIDLGAREGCDAILLVTPPSDISALEALRDDMRDTARACESGAQEISAVQARIAQAQRAHQALLNDRPAQTGLAELLTRFDTDALAPAVATATQAVASADATLRDALESLTVGERGFDALPDCPGGPLTATELAERHAGLTDEIASTVERLNQIEDAVAATAAKITRLSEDVGVASDEDVHYARERRDTLWQAHRQDLTAESADHFASAMKAVDDINFARLAHATELGELRKLGQDLAEAEALATKARAKRDRLRDRAKETESRAEGLMAEIGLPALSPAAFSDWVARHTRAWDAWRQREALARQHRDTLERAERLRQELAPLVALEDPTFDAALAAARKLAEAERAWGDEIWASGKTKAALEDEAERRQGEQTGLEDAAEQACAAWTDKVQGLFGDQLSPDRVAEGLGQLRELREHDTKRRQAERQVVSMQDDQLRFTEAVTALGARFGVEEKNPLEAFQHLREVAKQAQADKTQQEELGTNLEEYARRRAELGAELEDIERKVAELGTVFPETVDTGTLEALRVAVNTAVDVIEKRKRIAKLEGQVLDSLSLKRIDEVRSLLGGETAFTLAARAKSLEADLVVAEKRLSDATVARANAERDLGAVTGSAETAELVERRTTIQLQIEEAILDYLELSIGLRIAEDAIRRYRDRHRSGMLASTERAFAELTDGGYETLQTQPDGSSELLLAVDASGTPKQIGDMSKGTRFQLYLALRAAAYQQMVTQGVQLPFFCDDVFETFDDDRSRAACRLMERIGRSGQAIYLTHHRHVVDIAREVCDPPPVIHDL